jgi:hypothetical protein
LKNSAVLEHLQILSPISWQNTLINILESKKDRNRIWSKTSLSDLRLYSQFKKFKKTVEILLDAFLHINGLNERQVQESCMRISEYDPDTLSCIDYLLASTDYTEFVDMMVNYKESKEWTTSGADDFMASILGQKFEVPKKEE